MEIIIISFALIIALLNIFIITKTITTSKSLKEQIEKLNNNVIIQYNTSFSNLSKIVQESIKNSSDIISNNLKNNIECQTSNTNQNLQKLEERFKNFSLETEQRLENIRQTIERRLQSMQDDNNKKIDAMRQIVDEKLQETLNKRITESFRTVNEQLKEVYNGLGEMKNLAQGVGDLKKVLTNVKTRGILGEIQLGSILQEILSPEQYDTNVITKIGTRNPVEYAIKIPSESGTSIYLPIDSKFPGDTYSNLVDAYNSADKDKINECIKVLEKTIKSEAKDIRDKYIDYPNTTEFAIMFLPFEGLYAEVVNRGMIEIVQREFHVNIAGPSTMAALLNSLQMSFRTFAIQKRSGEVRKILGAVKTQFESFSDVLDKTLKNLNTASNQLDTLVGTRTRQIQRALKSVETIDFNESAEILEINK